VPDETLARLKRRAAQNRRSLQQELLSVVESAARSTDHRSGAEVADRIRWRLEGRGRVFSDSSDLIREDRGR
jgi:plasmid stability protein